jgi:protein-tyrosine-phosphatase
MLSSLRRLARFLGRLPDRLRHRARHREALTALQASLPRSILVVCHGNLCRSPYAAAALWQRLHALGLPVSVASAGYSKPNRASPAEALSAAAARGIDMSTHRSQAVTRTLLDQADLVVVMDTRQSLAIGARQTASPRRVVVLGDLDPLPIATREIIDPYGNRRAVFDECYARIDRCVAVLVRTLELAARSRTVPRPGEKS